MSAENPAIEPSPSVQKNEAKEQKYVQLQLLSEGKQDDTIFFSRVSATEKLVTLKRSYGEERNIPISSIHFHYAGNEIKDDDTAEKLGLKDDDNIAVEIEYPKKEVEKKKYTVKLLVLPQDPYLESISYKVSLTTRISKLKKPYCQKMNIPIASLSLYYDGNEIKDDDTPEKLGLMDEVKIGAHVKYEEPKQRDMKRFEFIQLRAFSENVFHVCLSVQPVTRLRSLLLRYSAKTNVPRSSLRFLFNGREIKDFHSLESLGITTEAQIEVQSLSDVSRQLHKTEIEVQVFPHNKGYQGEEFLNSGKVILRVIQDSSDEAIYRVQPTTKLKIVKNRYCGLKRTPPGSLKFFYKRVEIMNSHTPEKLGLKHYGIIKVFKQPGYYPPNFIF